MAKSIKRKRKVEVNRSRKYYCKNMILPYFRVNGKTITVYSYQLSHGKHFGSQRALKYVLELQNDFGYSVQQKFA